MCVSCQLLLLNNRISAELSSPAALAAEARPDAVEVVHRRLHELRTVRQDAGLEVAPGSALHPDSRAGEIGGADIGDGPVKHQNLEVHPRAERSLEARRIHRSGMPRTTAARCFRGKPSASFSVRGTYGTMSMSIGG